MPEINPFRARRAALLERLGAGVALFPTAPEWLRNRDSDYLYRFDSYFYYLTGFPEPEAVVALVAGPAPKTILFCREKQPERELWEGFRYGPEAAREVVMRLVWSAPWRAGTRTSTSRLGAAFAPVRCTWAIWHSTPAHSRRQ